MFTVQANLFSFRRLGVLLAFSLMAGAVTVGAAEKEKEKSDPKAKAKNIYAPRHDPAGMPFRNAPMNTAVRSVVVPLATNMHVAFDTELLRTHVAWEGKTLNLWGAVYHGAKDRFYCDYEGNTLWQNPPVMPWLVKELTEKQGYEDAVPKARYLGLSTKAGRTTFMYELTTPEKETILVHETPRHNPAMGAGVLERRLEISPTQRSLSFAAHIEQGTLLTNGVPPGMFVFDRGTNVLLVTARGTTRLKLESRTESANRPVQFWRENKNDSVRDMLVSQGEETRIYVRIPLHKEPMVAEVLSLVAPSLTEALAKLRALPRTELKPPAMSFPNSREAATAAAPVHVVPSAKGFVLPAGDAAYKLEAFPLPPEIELLVTGMDFLPTGELAVCTWLGDVYIVEQPQGAPGAAKYRRFARGLNEPGGLKVINGNIYIVQKQELTRLVDTDGNGEADLFECLNQDWGFTGNYHDFSFGPAVDSSNNLYVMRNGNRGLYEVPYMGWCLKLSPDARQLTAFCDGLRSPNGFGTYQGDIFMTENQGNWAAACKLTHMQEGKFFGFPSTKPAPKEHFENPKTFAPPAVWFPYSLAKSVSGFDTIPESFGPFGGQLMVGDFQNAILMRVALEKVNGEWQGAVFPFAKGFGSGVNRLVFGPDGKLYVGGCKNKAWAAVAPKEYSLDRVSFTGKTPFEVKEVKALKDGFELTFTQPIAADTGAVADSYDMVQFGYHYHQKYGSPELDHDGKENSSTGIKITKATLSADRLKVKLTVAGWKTGYVTMVRCLDVQGDDGKKLRHDTFWYTLNQVPK
jgi:glucose/arabinose dehydrogenase